MMMTPKIYNKFNGVEREILDHIRIPSNEEIPESILDEI